MTYGIKGAAIGAGMGAVAIAYQPPPPSAGTLVATTSKAIGTHAAQFGAIAAVFGMTDAVTTAVMGNDWKAHAVAGCAAGTLMGVKSRKVEHAFTGCGLFGAVQILSGLKWF
eukprot:CAMPEP_0181211524 /NCGR_PEP_ID=MMETSP1096-20121128/23830_1 /TAXON_ID=156174 ORGANISM="Chrysochromulina ericina, Strain CCMP281" /NCGR_SAMPLE_ID=MMETSP1096 /ASSEMBLY_ACC=CAM_ASM_000453 /LENGTH=111 /DNA_ID=CAMNT_0023302927 /DNA_START=52 /DNA_END=387 /DNA_ORIENTATION=+